MRDLSQSFDTGMGSRSELQGQPTLHANVVPCCSCPGLLLANVSVWAAGHLSREREGFLRRKVAFRFLSP